MAYSVLELPATCHTSVYHALRIPYPLGRRQLLFVGVIARVVGVPAVVVALVPESALVLGVVAVFLDVGEEREGGFEFFYFVLAVLEFLEMYSFMG